MENKRTKPAEKEQGKERAKGERTAETKPCSYAFWGGRGAVAVTIQCSKTELTDPEMESGGAGGWG